MARKQKASMFEKFLDLIGLAEEVKEDRGTNYDEEFDDEQTRGRSASKTSRFGDEFDDEPRMSRAQNKRSASSNTSASAGGNRFDADEGWGDASSRPEYGARTQQRAQSKTRTANGRYGSDQRGGNMSGKNNGRYDGAQEYDNYYRSGSSYQQNDHQQGTYRSGPSYGAGSRRYETDASYATTYSDSSAYDQYAASGKTPEQVSPRHQTVIFKLHSVDECKGVILALIEKKSVLLNLDELDSMQTQRTLDTMSGATFAIGARLSRASDRTWLITPSTVDVNDNPGEPAGSAYRNRYSI